MFEKRSLAFESLLSASVPIAIRLCAAIELFVGSRAKRLCEHTMGTVVIDALCIEWARSRPWGACLEA